MNKIIIPVLASVLILVFIPSSDVFALTETAKLTASDRENRDQFGQSVSVSGNIAIIGAHLDDDRGENAGSAYIFEKDAGGNWIEIVKLFGSDTTFFDQFGTSVSISREIAVVGNPFNDDRGGQTGAVYIFEKDAGGNWVQTAKLLGSDTTFFDFFGSSVSLSGHSLIVSSHGDDDAGSGSGSTYIFEKDAGGNWIETAKLTASDATSGDGFGTSVSISENAALVGSIGDDGVPNDSGSAYIFEKDAGGNWIETAKLTASDPDAFDNFGNSVSISGDVAIIAARLNDDVGSNSGSAYIFEKDAGGNWIETAKLTASDADPGNVFGHSVSISGDKVVVGSVFDDSNGGSSGSAYIFEKDAGGNWIETAKLISSDIGEFDRLGWSVSIDEDVVIVGALTHAIPLHEGAAYVFDFIPTIPGLVDQIIALGLLDSVTQSLSGPLEQAQNLLDDGVPQNDAAVCGKLTAFLNEVDAKEVNGQLTSEQADDLRATVQAVIEELGC